MENLEKYFERFRKNIIGQEQTFESPYGRQKIIYADWIASGRLYAPIEQKISYVFGPYVGNTHTETSITGTSMTRGYHYAQQLIKNHVNAGPEDVLITAGFGMTSAVLKLQRILGLKVPEQLRSYIKLPSELKPLVFVTHKEHHSNQTTWLETIADVVVLQPDSRGLVDVNDLIVQLEKHKNRQTKIGAFTACSNVSGIQTPYHQLAKIMHQHGGVCFVDFAASAPYVAIDMHPADPMEKLDAIYFSPHKFLGGPGTSGVLVFDSKLYQIQHPDQPGGGTVDWTNPWGDYKFVDNIEAREDGGTPGFLQAIKSALCLQLKEEMGVEKIGEREEHLVKIIFKALKSIPNLHILAGHIEDRLGVISFYVTDVHYNLIVKLLNDRFGIQVRGGCSCAGTYGHYLLHIDQQTSKKITDQIDAGDLSAKPGWVRLSIHPTMKDDEIYFIADAIRETVKNIDRWEQDYRYSAATNEFHHIRDEGDGMARVKKWFEL
ncbi:aminotransferase class V-fold PLP-dependent enzyme [candidate division KSB1 bacterium]|nr:MAG: aminotransferase class V-fold PLP-dependent enzyme [candidate division KSB1 bacterium]